ncbi:MAG: hypothetical protein FVQ83_12485 [Chloroflexi bacterium]|nr:hypothetical protein [Chloroflexota bacterium]
MLINLIRRSRDILGAVVGLVLFSPLIGLISLWIKRDSEGPVFFRGARAAKGGGTFLIMKFRTMFENPDSYNGSKVTGENDPRITRVGRWLRETKLNELPQLWNVLMGDMSLVGPRPEDPEITASWPEDLRQEILSVHPGITSPASVLYRNEEIMLGSGEVMDSYFDSIMPSKLRLDQLYVRNRSTLLDLDVLFWTLLVLLPRAQFYQPPENRLFWGPISRLMRRYFGWFTIDAFVAFVALGLTGIFWRTFGPLDVGLSRAIAISVGFALLFSSISAFFKVQRISWSTASATDVFDLIPPWALATLIAFGINNLFMIFSLPLIIVASVLSLAGFVFVRYRTRLITGFANRLVMSKILGKEVGERVLIIGCGNAGQFIAWMLSNEKSPSAFYVVGFVDDDLYKQGVRIRGFTVLGQRNDIPNLVEKHDVGIIVFAIHNISEEERESLMEICQKSKARIAVLPDFLGDLRMLVSQQSV